MKKILLIFLVSLFSACELFDLVFKQVDYVIDTNENYIYPIYLGANEIETEIRTLNRETFDISHNADIEKFLVKNILVDIRIDNGNICDRLHIGYSFSGFGLSGNIGEGTQYSDQINIGSSVFEQLYINDKFDVGLTDLRGAIQSAILNDQNLVLEMVCFCLVPEVVDITLTVTLQIAAEFTECEEWPNDLGLENC